MNLGLSENFGFIDFDHLTFPAVMRVDWVRVYQDPDNVQVGCNPPDYPTADYINQSVYSVLPSLERCADACTGTWRHTRTQTSRRGWMISARLYPRIGWPIRASCGFHSLAFLAPGHPYRRAEYSIL
jgi:hypothetical protein